MGIRQDIPIEDGFQSAAKPPEAAENQHTAPTHTIKLQPIVQGQHTLGYEALSRLSSNEGTSPEEFLRAANMFQHDCFIFEQACQFSSQHLRTSEATGTKPYVSVNLSAETLSSPLLIQVLKQTLELYRSRPHDIVIEILEDEFPIQKHAKIMKNIESLHQDLGLRLAIDDYGTGASDNVRVADLSRFLYAVKIDKSLINETALAQLSTSHFLKGKFLIFEGIETAENIDLVEKYFKNNAMQGHFFEKPLSTTDAALRADEEFKRFNPKTEGITLVQP